MSEILIIHIFTTFFMAGLCWFVQIVHYPLFLEIKTEEFPNYERKNAVTGYVTVPTMIIELLTGLYLLYALPSWLTISNVLFLGMIWLSTMIFQVPMHLQLMQIASPEKINKLISTNWIRTISWTIRSVIMAMLLLELVSK